MCCAMQDIRKAASTQPLLKREWQKSLNSTVELLNDRFERLSLKDRQIFTEEYAEDAEIDTLMHLIQLVDSSVECNHLQQKEIKKYVLLKRFMESHTRSCHYSFQVKKCDDSTFSVCKNHRLEPEQFAMCQWLPDPQPNPADQMPFSILFGKHTKENLDQV